MATAVVSGRIDEVVKRRADAVIQDAGLTTGEVIRMVWEGIAATKTLPVQVEVEDEHARKTRVLRELRELVDSAPSPSLVDMTDEQIKEMMIERYV